VINYNKPHIMSKIPITDLFIMCGLMYGILKMKT